MATAILLIVYGLFIELGAVVAYVRAKTKISLIVGGFSGAVLIVAGALVAMGMSGGSYVGLGMTVLLSLLFGLRYRRTGKFRPTGVMLIVSVLVAVGLVYLMFF